MKTYEFWTDGGDEDDIRANNLEEAARKASKRIPISQWKDGAWGYVRGKDGEQMDVPSRSNPRIKLPANWSPAQVRVDEHGNVQVKINPSKAGKGRFAKCVKAVEMR